MTAPAGQAPDRAPTSESRVATPASSDLETALPGSLLAAAGAGLQRLRADPRLTREHDIVALQRTAGNEAVVEALTAGSVGHPDQRRRTRHAQPAVQRRPLVQRDPPGAASSPPAPGGTNPPLTASLLKVPDSKPTVSGKTTAEPSADVKDAVKIRSGEIGWKVDVSLADGVDLGRGISVGFIQTLQSSERVAVYRKGGTPGGEIVAEKKIRTPKSGDALAEKNPETGEITRAAVHPWYSQPTRLSDSARGPFPIEFKDRPSFTVDTSFGEGRLTEIRGSDSFIVSVAAMDDGSKVPVYLQNQRWDLPWSMAVDPSMHGVGGEIKPAPSTEPAEVIEGPIARFGGKEHFTFPTVEAAMAAHPFFLISSLPELIATDPPGWWNAVEALRRKNTPVNLTVTVDETDADFTSDNVVATAVGHLVATKGGLTLNDGGSGTISFPLTEILLPLLINEGTTIEFLVMSSTTPLNLLERNRQPATLRWGFPFGRQRADAQRAGSGSYKLEVGLG